MYKILGADQREYGPVSAEQVMQWIREGRANANTMARAEGTETWLTLSSIPEFAHLFPAQPTPTAVPPGPPPNPDELVARISATDYDLDVGGCISGGWRLLMDNFGVIFGGTILFILCEAALSGLRMIPLIGILFAIANLLLVGPLRGGLYMLYLKRIRNQPVDVGEIFSGFSSRFWQLVLAYLIPLIFICFAAVPGGIVIGVAFVVFSLPIHTLATSAGFAAIPAAALLIIFAGLIIAAIPAIFLGICWQYTVPLTMDKGILFWDAMGLSFRMVRKHFLSMFGLMILCGLINLAGLIACCVGVLFSIPVDLGAKMFAYETIFSGRTHSA